MKLQICDYSTFDRESLLLVLIPGPDDVLGGLEVSQLVLIGL